MYSFMVKVSKKFNMRFALEAAYRNKSLNKANLTFGDMIDPRYGFVYQTNEQLGDIDQINSLDFSFGFLGYTPHLYFGLAINTSPPSISARPQATASSTPMPTENSTTTSSTPPTSAPTSTSSARARRRPLFGDISISPNFIYEHQLGFNYFNEGLYAKFYPFTVGVWCRHGLTYKYNYDNYVPRPDGTGIDTIPSTGKIFNSDAVISCSASNMTCSRWLIPTT
jgi:Protein of unknown function (DUF3308).